MYEETKFEKIMDWGDDHPFLAFFGVVGLIILAGFLLYCGQLNTGEKQYTGYIYSAEDGIAETVGHLRFSENAGMDEQPAFCVDKKDGKKIKDLAGSGKKVKVTVPAGFTIAWPWVCGIPANVEMMEEK